MRKVTMLNGNGALDTTTHRLLERVREELSGRRFEALAEAPTEELQAPVHHPEPEPERPVDRPRD